MLGCFLCDTNEVFLGHHHDITLPYGERGMHCTDGGNFESKFPGICVGMVMREGDCWDGKSSREIYA